jgi:type II secretory pathway pseudopilin PulG
MALAMAAAVVMGILLMKAAPAVEAQVQRENEAELIFRGEAIGSALKLYFTKTGRYPTSLEEVMKYRPRILRQNYKDPMTREGEWEFVTQVQPGASGNTQGLPIVGVRSKSPLNSIRIYQNKTLVHEWLFSGDQNLLGVTDSLGRAKDLLKAAPGATPIVQPTATQPAPQ